MRLLFATSLLPEMDATSGYEIANRCILQGLRALGHQVTAIGFAGPGRSAHVLPGSINLGEISLVTQEAGSRRKLGWLARAVAGNTTFAAAKLRTLPDADVAARIRAAGPFDAVILNGVTMAAAYGHVLSGLPAIYIAHNVEWKSAAEAAAAAGSLVERVMYEREARHLKAIEARLTARAAFVHVLAAEDIGPLGLAGTGRANVLPMTVHAEAPAPEPRAPVHDAAIIGTWSWAPNRIGLDWFVAEVMPRLPADFGVAIAGRLPAGMRFADPRITAPGRVPDARAFVRSGRVLPLFSRAGSGVQLKTLEAFELGLPTVATPLSVRGVGPLPANCTVAETAEDFAAALAAAARRPLADADGRAFHALRRAGLAKALAEGLDAVMTLAGRARAS